MWGVGSELTTTTTIVVFGRLALARELERMVVEWVAVLVSVLSTLPVVRNMLDVG